MKYIRNTFADKLNKKNSTFNAKANNANSYLNSIKGIKGSRDNNSLTEQKRFRLGSSSRTSSLQVNFKIPGIKKQKSQ